MYKYANGVLALKHSSEVHCVQGQQVNIGFKDCGRRVCQKVTGAMDYKMELILCESFSL